MDRDAKKNEAELLESTRETALKAAVEALRSIHKAKQVTGITGAAAAEPHKPSPVGAPARAILGDFLGDLARLSLQQVNGALTLHGRYADELSRWYAERMYPATPPRRPDPHLVSVRGELGSDATFQFALRNSTTRRAKVSFEKQSFRSADGAAKISPTTTFVPAAPELDPEQDWVVTATIDLRSTSTSEPITPGRYVGNVEVQMGERVTNILLIDLLVEAP
jgi:hypothetical protein